MRTSRPRRVTIRKKVDPLLRHVIVYAHAAVFGVAASTEVQHLAPSGLVRHRRRRIFGEENNTTSVHCGRSIRVRLTRDKTVRVPFIDTICALGAGLDVITLLGASTKLLYVEPG